MAVPPKLGEKLGRKLAAAVVAAAGLSAAVGFGAIGAGTASAGQVPEIPQIREDSSEPADGGNEPKARWSPPEARSMEQVSFPFFTGRDFNRLFSAALLPNLAIGDPELAQGAPPLTDDAELDAALWARAESRGYVRRPLPADYRLLRYIGGHTLQAPAAEAWASLVRDAAANGVSLELRSGFRGHDYQRDLFLRPLTEPYELEDLAARLRLSAPPGYSKHHTGYAVDVEQPGYEEFGRSPAYVWLAANNFANAKRHGWIPSYPADGGRQGPVPEPWEFTYVGVNEILCFHQPPTGEDPLCTGSFALASGR